MPLRIRLTVRRNTFELGVASRPIPLLSPEDMQMRRHWSPGFISASAHTLAFVSALLLWSGMMAQRAAAQDSSAPPTSESAMDSARASAGPSSVPDAQRIRRVIADGTHVVLTDGTIWEVYLPDR